jgi:hypothetical protein
LARIIALIPDLLFGSRVLAALTAAGHDVELASSLASVPHEVEVLVVDLTSEAEERIAAVGSLRPRKLGFYAHVEADVRARAQKAGFDLVVPRSRMAREGPALVQRLLS